MCSSPVYGEFLFKGTYVFAILAREKVLNSQSFISAIDVVSSWLEIFGHTSSGTVLVLVMYA